MIDTILSPGRRRVLGALGSLGAVALAGCGERRASPSGTPQFSGHTMGTDYVVKIAGAVLSASRLQALHADVQSALDGVDSAMSMHRADSELSRLNRHRAGTPLEVSRDLYAVLAAARHVSELSQGAFDISVAPLVRAWGFGPERHTRVPADEQLRAGRAALGWQGLQVHADSRRVSKSHPELQADLGGIAKGHGVDLAALALEAGGIEHYMIEVGGEVRTRGRNAAGQAWRIGIEQPDAVPQRARSVLPLSGLALATSGDYRFYFEHAGRRYSHEIDPRTAAPIAHGVASVSVVAPTAMLADALATALIVMGPEQGPALAGRIGLPALFIVRDGAGPLRDVATPAYAALAGAAAG